MFGLVYMAANLIGLAISGTKRSIDNAYYKSIGQIEHNKDTDLGMHTSSTSLEKKDDEITSYGKVLNSPLCPTDITL